jgi:hypothetical protein
MRYPASDFRTVQKHAEWAVQGTPAADDAIDDCVMFGSNLVLAGDQWNACHGSVLP